MASVSSASLRSSARIDDLLSAMSLHRTRLPDNLPFSVRHCSFICALSSLSTVGGPSHGSNQLTALAASVAEELSSALESEEHLTENDNASVNQKNDAQVDGGSKTSCDFSLCEENFFPIGPKLSVRNLPSNVTSQEVAEVFSKVASVVMVEVMYDRVTGKSQCCAFVTVGSKEDAKMATQKLDGTDIGGQIIKVNVALEDHETSPAPWFRSPSPNILFVTNLAWTVDIAKLEKAFSEHGRVIDVYIPLEKSTGRSRGFGFVTLSSEVEMNEALAKMNGTELEGRALVVQRAK